MIEISVLHASLSTGILDQRATWISPERQVPARIVQFTGITQTMVNNAPFAATVWPSFLPLIEDGILTGYNLSCLSLLVGCRVLIRPNSTGIRSGCARLLMASVDSTQTRCLNFEVFSETSVISVEIGTGMIILVLCYDLILLFPSSKSQQSLEFLPIYL